jgi:hypothetical protein
VAGPSDREVISALADAFSDAPEAMGLVERAGLRRGRQPSWQAGNAELFWSQVHRLFLNGAVLDGWSAVLREACLELPGHPVIVAAAAAAGVPGAARRPEPEPVPPGRSADPGARASTGRSTPSAAPSSEWDFFLSYTQADRGWAEWMAWQLENAGYSVLIQAWDFVPGSNWMGMMTSGIAQTERTIALISRAYLTSVWGKAEWEAALRRDPEGVRRKVLPIRIEDCPPPELLESVVSIDLFGGLSEDETTARLLAGVEAAFGGRRKPTTKPNFPPLR